MWWNLLYDWRNLQNLLSVNNNSENHQHISINPYNFSQIYYFIIKPRILGKDLVKSAFVKNSSVASAMYNT